MFYIIALLVFIADQTIKILIHKFIPANQSIPLIKNIFHLTYVQNSGAAFGFFKGQRIALLLIGLLVAGLIIYYANKVKSDKYYQIAFAFIMGGSSGNIVDRFFRFYVVDYLDFRFFPVFNLADIMINLGVFLLILKLLFFQKGEKGTKKNAS
ncbi:signal peptidase II [Candidatus Margulisiibacteriota bacterium]